MKDFGQDRVFSESNLGILCHYFLGVGRYKVLKQISLILCHYLGRVGRFQT